MTAEIFFYGYARTALSNCGQTGEWQVKYV